MVTNLSPKRYEAVRDGNISIEPETTILGEVPSPLCENNASNGYL